MSRGNVELVRRVLEGLNARSAETIEDLVASQRAGARAASRSMNTSGQSGTALARSVIGDCHLRAKRWAPRLARRWGSP